MRRLILALLLLGLPFVVSSQPASAQAPSCRFFTETGGFNVCDDAQARFLTAFNRYGLQRVGYPISRRYERDGFVTQAFQKAIFQWRPDGNYVAFVNVFDELHNMGFDQRLLETRQTPLQFPPDWDMPGATFEQIVQRRQGLLSARPAIRQAYFSVSDPMLFYGLPTSEVMDMGNHYAIRLQRAVLQEWKEAVPWAAAGQVTVANGADIAKELGALPASALVPETAGSPPPSNPPPANPPPAQPTQPPAQGCDPSYPTLCLPPGPPDTVNCGDISARSFPVLPPDPHRLDQDGNGIGCES
ncbi:MAG TPA: hypothetical protein VF707_14970 [Ardenticatenaceae bacterium]|jgi:hypothetical protein